MRAVQYRSQYEGFDCSNSSLWSFRRIVALPLFGATTTIGFNPCPWSACGVWCFWFCVILVVHVEFQWRPRMAPAFPRKTSLSRHERRRTDIHWRFVCLSTLILRQIDGRHPGIGRTNFCYKLVESSSVHPVRRGRQ